MTVVEGRVYLAIDYDGMYLGPNHWWEGYWEVEGRPLPAEESPRFDAPADAVAWGRERAPWVVIRPDLYGMYWAGTGVRPADVEGDFDPTAGWPRLPWQSRVVSELEPRLWGVEHLPDGSFRPWCALCGGEKPQPSERAANHMLLFMHSRRHPGGVVPDGDAHLLWCGLCDSRISRATGELQARHELRAHFRDTHGWIHDWDSAIWDPESRGLTLPES